MEDDLPWKMTDGPMWGGGGCLWVKFPFKRVFPTGRHTALDIFRFTVFFFQRSVSAILFFCEIFFLLAKKKFWSKNLGFPKKISEAGPQDLRNLGPRILLSWVGGSVAEPMCWVGGCGK